MKNNNEITKTNKEKREKTREPHYFYHYSFVLLLIWARGMSFVFFLGWLSRCFFYFWRPQPRSSPGHNRLPSYRRDAKRDLLRPQRWASQVASSAMVEVGGWLFETQTEKKTLVRSYGQEIASSNEDDVSIALDVLTHGPAHFQKFVKEKSQCSLVKSFQRRQRCDILLSNCGDDLYHFFLFTARYTFSAHRELWYCGSEYHWPF